MEGKNAENTIISPPTFLVKIVMPRIYIQDLIRLPISSYMSGKCTGRDRSMEWVLTRFPQSHVPSALEGPLTAEATTASEILPRNFQFQMTWFCFSESRTAPFEKHFPDVLGILY